MSSQPVLFLYETALRVRACVRAAWCHGAVCQSLLVDVTLPGRKSLR